MADRACREEMPFRHWLLRDVLPDATCRALRALPFAPPRIADTAGRRETHNSSRLFFGAEAQARHPVCAALVAAYQDARVVRRLETLGGIDLAGSFLRVELCLDTQGFWLEPHTDIGAKLFTHLVYLSTGPEARAWGTDLLWPDGTLAARADAVPNSGLIFVPATDTWHGFAPRPITGVRRTLIVNYVKPEWRSRHELAFPQRPVET
ncbi:hypothetical protein GCM10011611_57400 [Aliidongia dinghuensis]|uniref:2OG-Fe(II) oxygenase n=2 Tax=Aliidongia dinghuensis TaxID=1867774 RepID=A0A8J2YZV3_9PROT|nr:hypothetical protein GCM10011611_57400 [Aliidongia dinghuensis]